MALSRDQLEPIKIMVPEDKSKGMELAHTVVSGRQVETLEKKPISSLPQQELKPPPVTMMNIRDNILKEVISLNIKGKIREFKFDKNLLEI
ncbi:hypothetical protein C1646_758916 [Rhizophagus diaphanus]|nr:hypothetical protein C1646_758916 [Rhizophagus diaphanus] [Rhizophagus sp. MUCL 43196]